MSKLRIGVLRGGPSSEYDVSLKTGGNVLQNLSRDTYDVHDILITRNGVWHKRGFETPPEKVLKHVDVIFNALHGEYGEDGELQRMLDTFQIPYTGSGALASALAMNKAKAKEIASKVGIRTPLHVIIEHTPDIDAVILEVFRTFPQPVVIKPLDRGSSVGVIISRSYAELIDGVHNVLQFSPKILIEEYIIGKEATCGILDGYRGEENYVMMPVEIVPPEKNSFYDYESKYISDDTGYIIPGGFSREEKDTIQSQAKRIHNALGCSHYSRSDFIVSPRGIFYLETNTLPGLTSHSLVPKALEAAGCTFPEFIDHLINLAVTRK